MVTDAPVEAAPEGTAAAGNGEAPSEAPKDSVVDLIWLWATAVLMYGPKMQDLWCQTSDDGQSIVFLAAFIPMYKNSMKEGFTNLHCTTG